MVQGIRCKKHHLEEPCRECRRSRDRIVRLADGPDPNQASGRLILNFNQENKPFLEVEGAISIAEAIYMLECAKVAILEED